VRERGIEAQAGADIPAARYDRGRMWSLFRRLPRIGIVVCVALALFTAHKLYTMCCIRGFIGSLDVEVHHVTNKWVEHNIKNRTFCFLSWAEDGRSGDKRHRVQSECDFWETVNASDRIEAVRLDGDDEAELRGDGNIYASNGNFLFDLVLFGLELFGILYFWRRHQNRAAT